MKQPQQPYVKAKKQKRQLIDEIDSIKNEVNRHYNRQQDDLTAAITNDTKPNPAIKKDLEQAQRLLDKRRQQLSEMDYTIHNKLHDSRVAVVKERNKYLKAKGNEMRQHFNEMNERKIAYLQSVIDYSHAKRQYNRQYWDNFNEMESVVRIERHDPRNDWYISLNQRHQKGGWYNPAIYSEELRSALCGEMPKSIKVNKDKYK